MQYFSNKAEITPETLSSVSIFVICGSREKYTGSEVKFVYDWYFLFYLCLYEWFYFLIINAWLITTHLLIYCVEKTAFYHFSFLNQTNIKFLLFSWQLESIKRYIDGGGSVLVLLGEGGETRFETNINFLLEEYGIMINNGKCLEFSTLSRCYFLDLYIV